MYEKVKEYIEAEEEFFKQPATNKAQHDLADKWEALSREEQYEVFVKIGK